MSVKMLIVPTKPDILDACNSQDVM